MIVLLDMEKEKLVLYKQEESIPFAQIQSMYNYIDNENNVLYITNAIEVNADDIINMVKNMGVTIKDDILQDTDIKYLHGQSDGTIYIDETLKFEGKFDYKIIDPQMIQVIKTNQVLQNLIKNKKIEVIGERKKRKLMEEFKQFQDNKLDKQKLVDKQLDNIVLKTKVADWDGNITEDNHSDVVEIDINDRKKIGVGGDIGPTFNTMSELLDSVEGLE